MLNKKNIALLGAMAVAAIASTSAQAATETADAKVQIIAAVQIAQEDGLDFGIVASGAVAGTVTLLTSSDTQTCSTGLTCVGTALRGRFTVTAASGNMVDITVPGTATITAGGGNNMTIALLPSITSFSAGATPQEFFVGGTLTVGANQAAGNYTGSYVVTADYQ